MIGSVLIVDDDSRRAASFCGGLRELPCEWREARSADEAITLAKEENPDLALLRLGFGIDLFEKLAAISQRSGMFIALIIERGFAADFRKRALQINADGFISEESGEDERVAIVSALLRKKRAMDVLKQGCGKEARSWQASRPLRDRSPEVYQEVLRRYEEGVKLVLQNRIYKMNDDIFEPFRQIARELFRANATARDAVELHYQTLRKVAPTPDAPGAQAYLEVGRTTIIGLMGDLITCYRDASRNESAKEIVHTNGAPEALKNQGHS